MALATLSCAIYGKPIELKHTPPHATLAKVPWTKEEHMQDTYTAIIKQSGLWWIGRIAEVPGVNCQEPTREELLDTLKITLEEALEINRQEARKAAGERYEEIPLV